MENADRRQKIGRLGEDIAVKYLENLGFQVVGRNYRKKYGEIDIIAKKGEILHFVEVKSVSCEKQPRNVSRVTDTHRPEDNIHPQKVRRLKNTIQAYLASVFRGGEPVWQFDAITVRIDLENKHAAVRFFKDLIL